MIPADVAALLRTNLTETRPAGLETQAAVPIQRLNDVLSDLVPGQRILAEIQALLPNGAYRAVIAQREITLALPFSAKSGDTLELEVTESDGKLTLAFVANKTEGHSEQARTDSVATTLSTTGKLIGNLLGQRGGEHEATAAPLPLNNGQAIATSMNDVSTHELALSLKQAITHSGMFYEAHQARWANGELPTEALRQEPQGQLPPQTSSKEPVERPSLTTGNDSLQNPSLSGEVRREVVAVVQQQLEALATQQFSWQGQAWPGQQMQWEINEEPRDTQKFNDTDNYRWNTRLKLQLPTLGDVNATLKLNNKGELGINLSTDSSHGQERLQQAAMRLKTQYEAAGLTLAQFNVTYAPPLEEDFGST